MSNSLLFLLICTDSLTPIGGPGAFLWGVCMFSLWLQGFSPAALVYFLSEDVLLRGIGNSYLAVGENVIVCLSICPKDKLVTRPGGRTAGTGSRTPHNPECRESGSEMSAAEN